MAIIWCTTLFVLLPSVSYAQNESKPVLVISKSQYVKQLHGFWLGQNIANWTGLITEMDKVGTKETMPFYTDKDWRTPDLKAIWGEYVPHSSVIDFYVEPIGGVWGADDDTDIEYIYLHLLSEQKTPVLSAKQIQQGWLTHIYPEDEAPLFRKFPDSEPQKENFLWESNQRAHELMLDGVLPPATSNPQNNTKSQMIDAQLTTEFFGLLAPANPSIALKLSELPIAVSASDEAAEIARFYVVMHSLAISVDKSLTRKEQTQQLALKARKYLSNDKYPAKMFDEIWRHYRNNADKNNWESTRDYIYHRYQLNSHDGYQYHDPFEAGINFAASLVSLFYGEGDIKRTIQIGTLAGWDSDNPTATWGGLLGFLYGYQDVVSTFELSSVSDKYWIHRTRRNFPDHTPNQEGEDTLLKMADRMTQITQRIMIAHKFGRVDSNSDLWFLFLQE